MNDLSCGLKMWAKVSFVLSPCTRLTDRQTDRQKGRGNTVHFNASSCMIKIKDQKKYGASDKTKIVCDTQVHSVTLPDNHNNIKSVNST